MPSTRDPEEARSRLQRWLKHTLPQGSDPQVGAVSSPEATGMSSETLFFAASWREGSAEHEERLVARLAPEDSAFPVFPQYDLELQYRCLKLMADRTDVPVPPVYWFEPDPDHIGSAFFVTGRVEGDVPPDMMPYTMQGWVLEESEENRAKLQRNALRTLAGIHALDASDPALDFLSRPEYGETALDQHLNYQKFYYEWARGDDRYEVIEAAFDWLDAHRPRQISFTTINWGDSRIGNMLFRDCTPVAVLDWEMAALGPPEVDLAWFFQMHAFFANLATRYGMPGIPGFHRRSDILATYEEFSGRPVENIEFWEVFAQIRYAIVSIRTSERAIQMGQTDEPSSLEERIMNADLLKQTCEGTFWDTPLAE